MPGDPQLDGELAGGLASPLEGLAELIPGEDLPPLGGGSSLGGGLDGNESGVIIHAYTVTERARPCKSFLHTQEQSDTGVMAHDEAMSLKRENWEELRPLRLPVTPTMEKLIREAVFGNPALGLEPRIGFNELAREAGMAPMQLRRVLGMATEQGPMSSRTSPYLPAICRVLGLPESVCLPLSEDEIEMVRALHFVRAANGDVKEFLSAVKGFARVEATKTLDRPSTRGSVPPPSSKARPGAVKPRGSSDEHK
jgi:hypothetical protein